MTAGRGAVTGKGVVVTATGKPGVWIIMAGEEVLPIMRNDIVETVGLGHLTRWEANFEVTTPFLKRNVETRPGDVRRERTGPMNGHH